MIWSCDERGAMSTQPTSLKLKERERESSEERDGRDCVYGEARSFGEESWEILKQDIPKYSLHFFSQILEIAPAAKDMFSFLRDTDEVPHNNPKLKAHAVKVFKMTCETAIQLREKGKVVVADTTLQYLGSVHLKSGVLDPHFEVVKEALVRTLKEGLGEKYNEEVEGAWSQAYDHLALAIKAEMKQEDSQKP
ncbi:Non-symbiotic hemoglobin 2 [Raphanus sativus]|nr:Non-symbiotic hemoglobin 2 [Raphanus sativus]